MAIDANSGSVITLPQAINFVSDFRTAFPNEIKGLFAGKNKINSILQQEGCIGIRMYFGYDEIKSQLNLVLVGVRTDESDMTSGVIVERLVPCPSICDVRSALY